MHKLTLRQKFIQGLGGAVDPARSLVLTPLFLYYHTILGVSGTLIGLAVALIVLVDAVTDPIIGALSDRTRSSLGRRHPFMYSSIIPLGVCLVMMLNPPVGAGDGVMFVWVFVMGAILNASYTLFYIPYAAMLAELTDDYDVRTNLAAYRSATLVVATVSFQALALVVFLPATDTCAQGQLNAEGYSELAIAAGCIAAFFVFITTHFTREHIKNLPQATHEPGQGVWGLFEDIKRALSNKNFQFLFLSLLFFGVLLGATEVLQRHVSIFFWGLTSEDEVYLLFSVFGALLGVALAGRLQKLADKNILIIVSLLTFFLLGAGSVLARFANLVPPNDTPALLVFLVFVNFFRIAAVTLALLFYLSLLGDIVLEHEYNTGERQGGAMYAGQGFAEKAILGLGLVAGGIMLDWIGLPEGDGICTAIATSRQVGHLGLAAGVLIPIMSCVPLYLVYRIDLTRAKYADIREAVEARRNETA